jgi:succinate-semialdehyde dehydrogenase/glutarate-semialdehyde dehydrogenase
MGDAIAVIETVNPATGTTIERIPAMDRAQVGAKLDAAVRAGAAWRSESLAARATMLRAVAARFRSQSEPLAATAVREMGKPLAQARAEVEKCAWCLEYFAEHGEAMLASQAVASTGSRSYVAFRPLGVLLAIMPWNFPYWQVIRAAAPALMAGNTIVLKHATNTTRCALEMERIFGEAGAPAGCFGAILVSGKEASEIVADARIAAVTLTGSDAAGVAVATAAGGALKKCVLELGGADADLGEAARIGVTARFQNNGQSCIAAKRFIVEAPVYEQFVSRFAEIASAQRIGDPMDEQTQLGPSARDDLRASVNEQVGDTVAAGARLVCGGKPLDRAGFFYEATVVAGVRPKMRMFDEEVFGPAAAIVRASDRDDALALANDSPFGLGANLWTSDLQLAERMAARIEAGSVFVNGMVTSDPRLPFGGIKRSGYGRELSVFGIHEFVNVQTVWIG